MIKKLACLLLLLFLEATAARASSLVYIPSKWVPQTAKMVVVLHGCLQTPAAMALGTGWNQKADEHNLVIVYPQVPAFSHPLDCWSWYLPENQSPNSGQLVYIRNEIQFWLNRLGINHAPVFVTGISSGAATAAGLISCFPNIFSAAAIHSGLSYGLAANLKDATQVLKTGLASPSASARVCDPRQFKKPIMVIHGTADDVVHPKNVDQLTTDFLGEATPSESASKIEGSYPYLVSDFKRGSHLVGRIVWIEGLGHAWSGYSESARDGSQRSPPGIKPKALPFFDPAGPSSTQLIMDFFMSSQ